MYICNTYNQMCMLNYLIVCSYDKSADNTTVCGGNHFHTELYFIIRKRADCETVALTVLRSVCIVFNVIVFRYVPARSLSRNFTTKTTCHEVQSLSLTRIVEVQSLSVHSSPMVTL